MNQPAPTRHLALRLLLAVVVGTVVFGVAYLTAFFFLRGAFLTHSIHWTTRQDLKTLVTAIEAYKEQKGQYPARLADINGAQDALRHDADGRPVDHWGHPIQYSVTEDDFTLFSFGRDGLPGGEGDDADIHHDQPLEWPSLYRFTFEMPTQPIRLACVLTGIGAAVIADTPTRKSRGELFAGRWRLPSVRFWSHCSSASFTSRRGTDPCRSATYETRSSSPAWECISSTGSC